MAHYGKNGGQLPVWSRPADSIGYPDRPKTGKSLIWVGVFLLMIGWTALCLLGYLAADPLVAWLKVTVLGVVDSGQGLAEAVGGKVAGETVQLLKSSGIAGQIFGFAEMIAKPAILTVWFLGIVMLTILSAVVSFALRIIRRPIR